MPGGKTGKEIRMNESKMNETTEKTLTPQIEAQNEEINAHLYRVWMDEDQTGERSRISGEIMRIVNRLPLCSLRRRVAWDLWHGFWRYAEQESARVVSR
jgi:hypothetical protein